MTTHDFPTGNLGDVILTPARPESGFLDLRGTPKFYSLAEMNDLASRLAGGANLCGSANEVARGTVLRTHMDQDILRNIGYFPNVVLKT
jgi:hypothetical protein